MKEQIPYDIFDKVDIRIGTVLSVKKNIKARKPSLIIEVDFGEEIGIKKSSAQLTKNYKSNDLIKRQVAAVVNFETKQIGNLISEVLVLGFPDDHNEPILVEPNKSVPNGGKLY